MSLLDSHGPNSVVLHVFEKDCFKYCILEKVILIKVDFCLFVLETAKCSGATLEEVQWRKRLAHVKSMALTFATRVKKKKECNLSKDRAEMKC